MLFLHLVPQESYSYEIYLAFDRASAPQSQRRRGVTTMSKSCLWTRRPPTLHRLVALKCRKSWRLAARRSARAASAQAAIPSPATRWFVTSFFSLSIRLFAMSIGSAACGVAGGEACFCRTEAQHAHRAHGWRPSLDLTRCQVFSRATVSVCCALFLAWLCVFECSANHDRVDLNRPIKLLSPAHLAPHPTDSLDTMWSFCMRWAAVIRRIRGEFTEARKRQDGSPRE